jgi:hypothetical protein
VLKYLVLLVLVLGCAFNVAIRDEHAALDDAQKSADKNKPALAAVPDKDHPQKNPKNSYWNSPSGHIFHNAFRWPDGTTVWAILLTLIAIAEQTRHTAKAAEATRESARATQDQVQTMVERERARLVITSPPSTISANGLSQQVGNFQITVENIGATAAINVKGAFWASATGSDGPPNEKRMAKLGIRDVIRGDGGSDGTIIVNFGFVNGGSGTDLSSFYLHLWGRVDYNHLLSPKSCHTNFRFRRRMCQMRSNAASPLGEWERYGAEEDNECT